MEVYCVKISRNVNFQSENAIVLVCECEYELLILGRKYFKIELARNVKGTSK